MKNTDSKKVDWHTSETVANIVDGRVGECVANVLRAFLDHPDILPDDSIFIEGLYLLGGNLGLHTWIETKEFVIDPTIVRQPQSLLNERIIHKKVLTRDENEILRLYGDMDRTPGKTLSMKLDWDDPRVEKLKHEIDPP